MTLRKSTKIWIAVFAVSFVLSVTIHALKSELGCIGALTAIIAFVSGVVLLSMAIAALFRATVRRLTLRLAFSYFLIGIVPIPLLAMLLFCAGYILAHQFVALRTRREVTAIVREAAAREKLPVVRIANDSIESSDVPWLKAGEKAAWAKSVTEPRPVVEEGRRIWMMTPRAPDEAGTFVLVPVSRSPDFLQRLADRTGYIAWVEEGRARQSRSGLQMDSQSTVEAGSEAKKAVHPTGSKPADGGGGILDKEWVAAVYIENVAYPPAASERERQVVVWLARTSPRIVSSQLFAQGVPAIARIFRSILFGLSAVLLLVYLVALAIAFALVGTITRNVNRLTRASEAIARGDFSVRVLSRNRDQIGDLSRSFDGMAGSIERLLEETAEKKRLEGEIGIARTIQQKLLPPPEADLPGLSLVARFEPLAAIGGDYYDYFRLPDGRSAVAVGDVSGHGLPTGLLVAMAKASLSTLLESGLTGPALFSRVNELITRSTDSRNYMTLAVFAFDAATRRADLTNGGQLAPYRISNGTVEAISLPSFPLGLSEKREFPSREFALASGDRVVFVTDGFVEATNADGEPFGFDRLESLLKAEAASNAEQLRDAILAAVTAHIGTSAAGDDRTLVILAIH
ncbi:MAG TPA: SpoIIE family protein phosphatase [Thermoanaerobaculia bacterium]|nr:SpoIIE family protein phosphatase [Thermoanaerobaculia bacterium]